MLRLNILMQFNLISRIEKLILQNNGEYFLRLNKKEFTKFLNWYFSQEYQSTKEHQNAPFKCIELATNALDNEDIDEQAISSKLFTSIPEERIYSFFKTGCYYPVLDIKTFPLLQTYLTSRITDDQNLINLLNRSISIDADYAYRKLAEEELKQIIRYFNSLMHGEDRKNFTLQIFRNHSLEDLKIFFESIDCPIYIIVEGFTQNYNNEPSQEVKSQILDTLISLFGSSTSPTQEETSIEENYYHKTYEEYARNIAANKNVTEEMKNQLAQKLLKDKNYDFIYYWFTSDIECAYNYQIIAAMTKEDADICTKLLMSINDKYLEHAFIKIINQGKEKVAQVIHEICEKIEFFEISRVDKILAMVYFKDYNFQISKEDALSLILAGSIYIPKFINDFEFAENEREMILASFENSPDLLSLYGAYLHSGFKDKLLPKSENEEKLAQMRARRSEN